VITPGFRRGFDEAFGVPAAVLAAGYIGCGAMASDIHFPVWLSILSTMTIWALPGQLILLEMTNSGAPALVILLAVMFSAVRFLPMTVSLLPILRGPRQGRKLDYVAAQLVAMTGWAVAMRRGPEMPQEERMPYFIGFTLTIWSASVLATAAGFFIADSLPAIAKMGFVFLNPVYFLLVLLGDARERTIVLSLAGGAICGPLIYLASPQWSVLAGGLIGGTLAFLIHQAGVHRG
jgi:predicted branched-subunit amino acid permease